MLIEPFLGGSHQAWAEGFKKFSGHEVEILSLPARNWKWRMHGAAILLARKYQELEFKPDILLVSDMLDLNVFLSLTRKQTSALPTAAYFHENQLTYPWSRRDPDPDRGRDLHYGFINYTTALAADRVIFNSGYHQESFCNALESLLQRFPDFQEQDNARLIRDKSLVLYPGLDLEELNCDVNVLRPEHGNQIPVFLWNHRREYDKNPEEFFEVFFKLAEKGLEFRLILLGEDFKETPPVFREAAQRLGEFILHSGFARDRNEYVRLLRQADCLPVTSYQDFYGISILEAIHCGCVPLLPKRLTYPELIDIERFPECFYKDPEELLEKVETFILNFTKVATLQMDLSRFGWRRLVSDYDRALEELG